MKDGTMRPMEAWRIISGIMSELSIMRKSLYAKSKCFCDDEITAMIMAFEALRRMEEDT